MGEDHKDSVKRAIENYHKKQAKKQGSGLKKVNKRNGKPEKVTEIDCMKWMREAGFSMNVVEAKAVYNQQAGMYLNGQTVKGFPDSAGCTPHGVGCFVEFKARGKRATLRYEQREFLKEKILLDCFACVVDTYELLRDTYNTWRSFGHRDDRIAYLLSVLPKKKDEPNEFTSLFD